MIPPECFSEKFVAHMNSKIDAVLTQTPKAKAKVFEEMQLNHAEQILFDAAREVGMFSRVQSQRGKGGGMFIELVK
jgi:hypothetical protein